METYNQIKNKIFELECFLNKVSDWKSENRTIVFTNGCFDLLHLGHIDYLSKTSDLADKFVIGLNSDSSVRKIKGKHRPVKDELSRAMLLSSFVYVDAVVIFSEETPFNLINKIAPDILVKGGDYREDDIIGADLVKSKGGKVVILPFLEGYSTTNIVKKILNSENVL